MSRVLVIGPYPPVPGRSAQATLGQVRRLVASGDDVLVAAPRAGAAHLHLPVTGPRGAARLAAVVSGHEIDRVVLCLAPGVPFEPDGTRRDQQVTASAYARLVGRRTPLELVLADDPACHPEALATLVRAASGVRRLRAGLLPDRLSTTAVLGAVSLTDDDTSLPDLRALPGPVTVDGPAEQPPAGAAAAFALRTGRRVLGRHAGTVGRPARRAVHLARRARRSLGAARAQH